MARSQADIWSQWLLQRRFGGDPQQMQTMLDWLYPVRDEVLRHAALGAHEVLLDVGCGDGLIAFGALEKVPSAQVIFSDISQDILDHARTLAEQLDVLDRCRFVRASANNLAGIDDASVDAVTTRSVIIYVQAKQQAFDECYRVLKPGGRLSIFEPINRFGYPEPPNRYRGYDVTPIQDLAAKVKAVHVRRQPPETNPMLDFDERDLLIFAERAGFKEVHLELRVSIQPYKDDIPWETRLQMSPNPQAPTFGEVLDEALTPSEQERFTAYLRPLMEGHVGIRRSALAYLWAVK